MAHPDYGYVLPQTFDYAHEFIDALRLTNPSWTFHEGDDPAWQRGWYFRGHGDASWPLTPTAFREYDADHQLSRMKQFQQSKRQLHRIENLLDRAYTSKGIGKKEDIFQREVEATFNALCEYMLIREFIQYANELGHPVPEFRVFGEHPTFVEYYIEASFRQTELPIWLSPATVLAQHHGIPTRLLDWTANPLVAAYFAASSVPKENSSGTIAVYALSHFLLNMAKLTLTEVPRSMSSYVRAQSGLLTYYLNADDMYIKKGKYLSLEEALEVELRGSILTQYTQIRKFMLPVSEVGELLRLLWLENISKAHLMPILDNVTEALKLKWRFARTGK